MSEFIYIEPEDDIPECSGNYTEHEIDGKGFCIRCDFDFTSIQYPFNRERVNHPSHYNTGDIEVIEAIEAWGFLEGFCKGSAIKYIARAGHKDPGKEGEDLEKAIWYLNYYMGKNRKDK